MLLAFGYDLTVIGIVGIILLIGIVKKNGIMMVDVAIHLERNEGVAPLDAIRRACLLRFRPILMTTMAALLSGLPLMLEGGAGSELRKPLGFAMVGGLALSQMLTLYTTPVIYLYLDKLQTWSGAAPRSSGVPRLAKAVNGANPAARARLTQPAFRPAPAPSPPAVPRPPPIAASSAAPRCGRPDAGSTPPVNTVVAAQRCRQAADDVDARHHHQLADLLQRQLHLAAGRQLRRVAALDDGRLRQDLLLDPQLRQQPGQEQPARPLARHRDRLRRHAAPPRTPPPSRCPAAPPLPSPQRPRTTAPGPAGSPPASARPAPAV